MPRKEPMSEIIDVQNILEYYVRSGDTIQSVIDSITDEAVDNLYTIIVPTGHETESFTETDHIYVVFRSDGTGKTLDLSTTTTFRRSDGSNFVINCTDDAAFNSTGGAFSTGFSIRILNIGTHIITLDGSHIINPGQQSTFVYNGNEFVGG